MVEIENLVTFEAVDHLEGADHIPVGVFRAFVDECALLVGHPAAWVVAVTPFLADDSALIVQSLLLAGDVARPVVKHHQHRVHERIPHQRHLGEVVDGLRPGSICIDVVSEADAFLSKKVQNALAGVVAGAVEGHMLEEVGQAVLVVLFLEGSNIVRDVEFRAAFRLLVMA